MHSTSIDPARPGAAVVAKAPFVRRAVVAMTLTGALAGGTLVAGAGAASATTDTATTTTTGTVAAEQTPTVRLDRTRNSARQGKGSTKPKFTVTVRSDGAAVKGRAALYIHGSKVAAKKLGADGTTSFRPLLRNYKLGRNKVVVKVAPAAVTGLGDVTKVRFVQLKAKAAPNVAIKQSRKSGTKGKSATRPKFTVKAARWGDPVRGRVAISVKGKHVATRKLHHGKATFRPGWNHYRVGRNKVRVAVLPAGGQGLHKVAKARWVKAKKKITRGQKVVRVANRYVGYRYTYGGTSPSSGFDCSGFTSYVYKKAIGKTLPRSSSAQRSVGHRVARSHAKKGDIVYTPGHVAIYAGNGRVIEAARPGVGVVKRSMWQDSPTFIRV
ncbi:C40 family peptidase [Isoptericola aurantiacus]|uniref:C40 family peptidase n=1 Tax=Isoptericola aurantiacus TaxID=3377839 RepID=UPI00383AD4F0